MGCRVFHWGAGKPDKEHCIAAVSPQAAAQGQGLVPGIAPPPPAPAHLAVHGAQVNGPPPVAAPALLHRQPPHGGGQQRAKGVIQVSRGHAAGAGQACKLGSEGAHRLEARKGGIFGLGGRKGRGRAGWVAEQCWSHCTTVCGRAAEPSSAIVRPCRRVRAPPLNGTASLLALPTCCSIPVPSHLPHCTCCSAAARAALPRLASLRMASMGPASSSCTLGTAAGSAPASCASAVCRLRWDMAGAETIGGKHSTHRLYKLQLRAGAAFNSDNNPAAAAAHPVCDASCRCGSSSCAAASAAARSARRNSASGTCKAGREASSR